MIKFLFKGKEYVATSEATIPEALGLNDMSPKAFDKFLEQVDIIDYHYGETEEQAKKETESKTDNTSKVSFDAKLSKEEFLKLVEQRKKETENNLNKNAKKSFKGMYDDPTMFEKNLSNSGKNLPLMDPLLSPTTPPQPQPQVNPQTNFNKPQPQVNPQTNFNKPQPQVNPQTNFNKPQPQVNPQTNFNKPQPQVSPQTNFNRPQPQVNPQTNFNRPQPQVNSVNEKIIENDYIDEEETESDVPIKINENNNSPDAHYYNGINTFLNEKENILTNQENNDLSEENNEQVDDIYYEDNTYMDNEEYIDDTLYKISDDKDNSLFYNFVFALFNDIINNVEEDTADTLLLAIINVIVNDERYLSALKQYDEEMYNYIIEIGNRYMSI